MIEEGACGVSCCACTAVGAMDVPGCAAVVTRLRSVMKRCAPSPVDSCLNPCSSANRCTSIRSYEESDAGSASEGRLSSATNAHSRPRSRDSISFSRCAACESVAASRVGGRFGARRPDAASSP